MNISFVLTQEQIKNGTKTVTRRLCDFCNTGIAEWDIEWGNGGETQWACQDCTENENEMIGVRCKECDLYFHDYEMQDRNFDRDMDYLFTCDKCIGT